MLLEDLVPVDAFRAHAPEPGVSRFEHRGGLAGVELVADFDTDGIRGTVDRFRSLSGAESGEPSVMLDKTTLACTGAAFPGAKSAGVPGHGAWGGQPGRIRRRNVRLRGGRRERCGPGRIPGVPLRIDRRWA